MTLPGDAKMSPMEKEAPITKSHLVSTKVEKMMQDTNEKEPSSKLLLEWTPSVSKSTKTEQKPANWKYYQQWFTRRVSWEVEAPNVQPPFSKCPWEPAIPNQNNPIWWNSSLEVETSSVQSNCHICLLRIWEVSYKRGPRIQSIIQIKLMHHHWLQHHHNHYHRHHHELFINIHHYL